MEREEARSIRDALEEMDLKDEERLQCAAQDEATELVRNHQLHGLPKQSPYSPYHNPDVNTPNRFRHHLEKSGHAKRQSFDGYREASRGNFQPEGRRSTSESSGGSGTDSANGVPAKDPHVSEGAGSLSVKKNKGSLRRGHKVNFALPPEVNPPGLGQQKNGAQRRNVSNGSSKGIFRNPDDYIYEEPEETSVKNDSQTKRPAIPALTSKSRNSLPRGARPLPERSETAFGRKRPSIFDIHKNRPTQSRNPLYTSNTKPQPAQEPKDKTADTTPKKDGIEIRSEDIRAATSMRMKDRSHKLPMPSAVSDRPGRPIVSFDPNWKSQEDKSETDSSKEHQDKASDEFVKHVSPSPPVAINVSDTSSIPSINVANEETSPPSISVSAAAPPIAAMEPIGDRSARPLPEPGSKIQEDSNSKPANRSSRSSWISPYIRTGVPSAACATCGLQISGRIVTACGSRFHPECFKCHHCNTGLECVAFYQEPDTKRSERLENADPGDEEAKSMRFYCHLDFHELFSPRCKSCKTPIEGEVIVACGAEWHVGHFFCAECGDPFNSTTPFVEKNGYAWCVQCHSKRTASRCMGCKVPVLDEVVVSALGGQWHDKCFNCNECGGGFGPQGRFFVKQGPPRFTAKGRQIGGPVEFAVCELCEGRRLKA